MPALTEATKSETLARGGTMTFRDVNGQDLLSSTRRGWRNAMIFLYPFMVFKRGSF
jgi:hypothetical protein